MNHQPSIHRHGEIDRQIDDLLDGINGGDMAYPSVNEQGNQYGYLKVLGRSKKKDGKYVFWDCLCANCNTVKPIRGVVLRREHGARSCGFIGGRGNRLER